MNNQQLQQLRDMLEADYAKLQVHLHETCTECEKPIPFERLEAMPTALTCIDHVDEEQ